MDIDTEVNLSKDTTLCPKKFECLTGNLNSICELEYVVFDTVFFIKENGKSSYCPFKMDFGKKPCCTCLTRIELWRKYGI